MSSAPPFVADARRFAAEEAGSAAFRLFRLYTGCTPEELEQAASKVWSESIPENTYAIPEGRLKRALGLCAFAWTWPWRKAWLWRPDERRDWILETIDEPYFRRWFARLFAALPGRKAVSPRGPFAAPDAEAVSSYAGALRLRDGLALAALAPLMSLAVEALSRRRGLDLRQAYRQAVTLHTVMRGFFARHPCRDFITFDDESNPPARVLAFRRSGGRRFVVIQNGERNRHPHIAFGLMDAYYLFGPAYERVLLDIGTRAGAFLPVGALCLNYHHETVERLRREGGPSRWDVLFIDQGVYPHNGLDERSGRSLETIMARLGELKRRRPELRIAYQLRKYHPEQAALKALVLETAARLCGPGVELRDNPDGVESYRAAMRSELVMTFESTLGFEALMLPRRALFVNFSGDPAETLCPDPRWQLEDPAADYGRFEAKVLELLGSPAPTQPPPVALDRHLHFDGRVQERIAQSLSA